MESSDHLEKAQELVGKLAQKLGLSDVFFNDDGEVLLDYSGTEVFIYIDETQPVLHVTAPVGTAVDDDKKLESMMEAALKLNMFPDKLHDTRFAFARDVGTFVLCKRIDLNVLPENELDVPLGDFLEMLREGQDLLMPKETSVPAGRA